MNLDLWNRDRKMRMKLVAGEEGAASAQRGVERADKSRDPL